VAVAELASGAAMSEMAIGLVVGAVIGYGIRAFMSHYRRAAAKRRLGVN